MKVDIRFAEALTKSVYYKHNNGEDYMSRGMCELLLAVRATIDEIAGFTTFEATGAGAEIARVISEQTKAAVARDRARREQLEAEEAAAIKSESEIADAYLAMRIPDSAMWSISTGRDNMDTMQLWYRDTDCALLFIEPTYSHAESHESYESVPGSWKRDGEAYKVVYSPIVQKFRMGSACADGSPDKILREISLFESDYGIDFLLAERDGSGITCKRRHGVVIAKYNVGPRYLAVLSRMQRRLMNYRPDPREFSAISHSGFEGRSRADMVNEFLCITAMFVRRGEGRPPLRAMDRRWARLESTSRMTSTDRERELKAYERELLAKHGSPPWPLCDEDGRTRMAIPTLLALGHQDLFMPPAPEISSADDKGFIEEKYNFVYPTISLDVQAPVPGGTMMTCEWVFFLPPGTPKVNIEALNSQFPKRCIDPEKLDRFKLSNLLTKQDFSRDCSICYPSQSSMVAVRYAHTGKGDLGIPMCNFLIHIHSLVISLIQQYADSTTH